MGAVLVIALFYTGDIAWRRLGMAGIILLLLIALNVLRVRRLTPYLVLGLGLWFFVHESGVHATIAGVLLAFAIPTRTRINAAEYSAQGSPLAGPFRSHRDRRFPRPDEQRPAGGDHRTRARERTGDGPTASSGARASWVLGLRRDAALCLLKRGRESERIVGRECDACRDPGTRGRETAGITGAALAAVRLRLAALPEGVSWTALHGCAWLGGIGFTMSLFIATLAFQGTDLLDSAKVGILGGSIVAGVVGAIVVRLGTRSAR